MTKSQIVGSVSYHHVLLPTGEVDLRDVRSAVADLAGKWKPLGICLGIRLNDLDNIRFTLPSECLTEMLAIWLRQSYNVRSTLILCLPRLIYYTKCTSLVSKGSKLEPVKILFSYKLSPW